MKRLLSCLAVLCMLFSVACAESAASLDAMYKDAELLMVQGDYIGAASKFEAMGAYADASQMAMYCKAVSAAETLGVYEIAIDAFADLGDFKDSKQMASYYLGRLDESKGDSRNTETALDADLAGAISNYNDAIAVYMELALFKDSMTRISDCQAKITAVEQELAVREADKIENAYLEAVALEEAGKYRDALAAYQKLDGYKDSTARILVCQDAITEETYQQALALENEGKYEEAIGLYKGIIDYKDAKDRIGTCKYPIYEESYLQAVGFENEGKYKAAIETYMTLNGYKDSKARINSCTRENFEGTWNWLDRASISDSLYKHAWNPSDQYYEIDFDSMKITLSFSSEVKQYTESYDFEVISPMVIRCKSFRFKSNDMWYLHLTETADHLALSINTKESPKNEIALQRNVETTAINRSSSEDLLKEYTDKETVQQVQAALNEAGYDCGKPDGIAGKGTTAAVTQYQTDNSLNATGTITHELLMHLGLAA